MSRTRNRMVMDWTKVSACAFAFLMAASANRSSDAADLLMFPDLPPGVLYTSGVGDPFPAEITPILGHPDGAYSGSDYFFVQTGTVLNGGQTFGGIQFMMPDSFLNLPVPQRYKLEVALASEDQTEFDLQISNQNGSGENNALSHVAQVGAEWELHEWYATLDGSDLGGHANIPRTTLYFWTDTLRGGPFRLLLIDDITLTPVMIGDFDEDNDHDHADVDALVGTIVAGTHTQKFDLTGDGFVDHEDLDEWRAVAGEALLGPGKVILPADADLDGVVDVSDFTIWNGHKFTQTAAWSAADFNADGVVDVSDFGIWNAHKFQSADLSGAIVPEPSALPLVFWAIAAVLPAARRLREVTV